MLVALEEPGVLVSALFGVGKMRKALIDETGLVVNVIEIQNNSSYLPPEGHKLVASTIAGVGDTYASKKFTKAVIELEPMKVVSDVAFTKDERRAIRERLGLEG